MPTPLPAVVEPDYAPTLNAYRTGVEDKFLKDKRENMKAAGGLAAAGNYKGAMSSLYGAGNFDEARNVAGELRAQSAEGRAQGMYASNMKDAQLERSSKTHELFGRLIDQIGNDPNKLEQAKSMIKQQTGLDLSQVTMQNLPMYKAQGVSMQQQLDNEMSQRRFDAEKLRADQAQSNSNRTFDAGRQDAASLNAYRGGELENTKARIDAMLKKAGAAKPLSENQGKARGYEIELNRVNADLKDSLADKRNSSWASKLGGLPAKNRMGELGESPLSSSGQSVAMNNYSPGFVNANTLNTKERQFLQQAEQFISVLLYHRSGAQISSEEFGRNYRIYFPQPGDDVKTRRQKAQARKDVISGMHIQGGYDAPGVPDAPAATNDWSDIKVLSDE